MSTEMNSIFQSNAGYVEEMFARYSANPQSVAPEWRSWFEGFNEGFGTATRLAENRPELQEILTQIALNADRNILASNTAPTIEKKDAQNISNESISFELNVHLLVQSYKNFGHLKARINPLYAERNSTKALNLEHHGLKSDDLAKNTSAGISFGWGSLTLADLIARLEKTYCGSVGIEYSHISDPDERKWLENKFSEIYAPVDSPTQQKMYSELAAADALEKTIGIKYLGKKRFSIEGADAQIPALESFIEAATQQGAKEFCLAMAHRGRLNILVNVVKKPLKSLFAEFEGYPNPELEGDGDVKYHHGFECHRKSRNGIDIDISLSCNPSHLEFVAPVALGETRAKQVLNNSNSLNPFSAVVPIILHGDAAFAGQGVVYETFQMMLLKGYAVGGTLHLIANNQVGFTTNPSESRSTEYCSDLAKTFGAPVFHVNASDIDALHNVMNLAAQYRQKTGKDVVVDLVCFRRHGHNENDEPNFTQPGLYKIIKNKKAPCEDYAQYLCLQKAHEFNSETLSKEYDEFKSQMTAVIETVRTEHYPIQKNPRPQRWQHIKSASEKELLAPVNTKVTKDTLKSLGQKILKLPADFNANPKLARTVLTDRQEMMNENILVNWGMGELLSYASLLNEGYSVRLAGQDTGRGTFGHRNVTLIDFENDSHITPISNCAEQGARFEVIDTHLSETAAMAFEYGYALQHEKALVLWEGQFGDFGNGAQVIIDQFIAAGNSKWGQTQALTLLLPHGYEGQGPEHSSGRIERFMQLAAQGNMQICIFSNVGQLFHALRRQVVRSSRTPLVIFTPKSFLRSQRAAVTLDDLAEGTFEEILDDNRKITAAKVNKIIICSGKISLDLFDALEKPEYKTQANEVAILRLEQLYPLASDKIVTLLKKFKNAVNVCWVQEEPKNMGAWMFVRDSLQECLSQSGLKAKNLGYIGRTARASPSVGLEKAHLAEQEKLVALALGNLSEGQV